MSQLNRAETDWSDHYTENQELLVLYPFLILNSPVVLNKSFKLL